jgi:hypothetical protein
MGSEEMVSSLPELESEGRRLSASVPALDWSTGGSVVGAGGWASGVINSRRSATVLTGAAGGSCLPLAEVPGSDGQLLGPPPKEVVSPGSE